MIVGANLHPYVIFLPSEQKTRVLGAIFGSRAAVAILKFSLARGISNRIYQKTLVDELDYSNKTVIQNLQSLTKLGVLLENMEKKKQKGRTVWVKAYDLTDVGRWFALLLADENDLSKSEKAELLQSLFRSYIKWVIDLSETLGLDKQKLRRVFEEEMK